MSDEEPKTAIEIAMEKLEARGDLSTKTLTDDQKVEIADIRSRLRARIAEFEIKQQDKMNKAASLEEVQALQEELLHEKKRLQEKMEEEVEQVRERES